MAPDCNGFRCTFIGLAYAYLMYDDLRKVLLQQSRPSRCCIRSLFVVLFAFLMLTKTARWDRVRHTKIEIRSLYCSANIRKVINQSALSQMKWWSSWWNGLGARARAFVWIESNGAYVEAVCRACILYDFVSHWRRCWCSVKEWRYSWFFRRLMICSNSGMHMWMRQTKSAHTVDEMDWSVSDAISTIFVMLSAAVVGYNGPTMHQVDAINHIVHVRAHTHTHRLTSPHEPQERRVCPSN